MFVEIKFSSVAFEVEFNLKDPTVFNNFQSDNEIIRLLALSFTPLEVKKILFEEKTNHHNIKIYEAYVKLCYSKHLNMFAVNI